MAIIETNIDLEKDLTIFSVKGELTADEIIQYASGPYDQTPTKLVIWDVSEGYIYNNTSSQFRNIAIKMKKLTEKREGGKTAFVGNRDADFGMGRMYEVFAKTENLPIEFKSFKSFDEAMKWLGI